MPVQMAQISLEERLVLWALVDQALTIHELDSRLAREAQICFCPDHQCDRSVGSLLWRLKALKCIEEQEGSIRLTTVGRDVLGRDAAAGFVSRQRSAFYQQSAPRRGA